MNLSRPSVSVVIPAHDRPEYLVQALDSVMSQTHQPDEIIVVDDASSVDLMSVALSYPREIRFVRQQAKKGANAARNAGAALATSDLIAFLDDDDIWLAQKLERQISTLKTQNAEACVCGYRVLGGWQQQLRATQQINAAEVRKMTKVAGFSSLVVTRSAVLELGLDENLPNAQDWDFYVRLVQRKPIAYVPDILYEYRIGASGSISSKTRDADIASLEKRTQTIRKHRAWMGERNFRRGLADILLSHVARRRAPWSYIRYSARQAGLAATGVCMLRKLARRLGGGSFD